MKRGTHILGPEGPANRKKRKVNQRRTLGSWVPTGDWRHNRTPRKGQLMIVRFDKNCGVTTELATSRSLASQIQSISVGGGGWYTNIAVVRVERMVDPEAVYAKFVKKRDGV